MIIHILSLHRLLPFVKRSLNGAITARHATTLGDCGRGPKDFRDFGRFSKCTLKSSSIFSQAIPFEGFVLSSKKPLDIFCSSEPSNSVSVFVARETSSSLLSPTLIHTDIAKVGMEHLSSMDIIFGLVYSIDFRSI